MELRRDGWYRADKGKRFVLTEKGKAECASYSYKTVGEPVSEYDYEAVDWAVGKEYVIEVDIPGWTTLVGYEVVYYNNGYRLHAGNAQTFPTRKAAEAYKKHYESYPWWNDELFIEEVEYEGGTPPIPIESLSTPEIYKIMTFLQECLERNANREKRSLLRRFRRGGRWKNQRFRGAFQSARICKRKRS